MAQQSEGRKVLLQETTTVGAGSVHHVPAMPVARVFQVVLTGTGAISATIDVYGGVSEAGCTQLLATLLPTGTTTATDYFTSNASWPFLQANTTSISGTAAQASVSVAGA